MTNTNKVYDLEERCAKFGEATIKFARLIPIDHVTQRIVPQFVAAGTSLGANYAEAADAESGRDFKHKIGICKKEAREVKHWLRMIAIATPKLVDESRVLWQEAKELHLIFNSIYKKVDRKKLGA